MRFTIKLKWMYFLSFELMELKIAVELLLLLCTVGTVAYGEITSKRAGDFIFSPS